MAAKKKSTGKSTRTVARRPWEPADEKLFKQLHKVGTPTGEIAKKLKRSAASVRSKAQKFGLTLRAKTSRARK